VNTEPQNTKGEYIKNFTTKIAKDFRVERVLANRNRKWKVFRVRGKANGKTLLLRLVKVLWQRFKVKPNTANVVSWGEWSQDNIDGAQKDVAKGFRGEKPKLPQDIEIHV